MHTQDSTPAGKRALLPLLMVLAAACICSQATAAWGHLHPPVFAPAENPDSLNVERVGEVVLLSLPEAGDPPYGTDLFLAGDHALMGDFRGIVHIVDISDPAAMRKVGEVRTPGSAVDIKVEGGPGGHRGAEFHRRIRAAPPRHLRSGESGSRLSRLEEKGWGGVHNLFIQGERRLPRPLLYPGPDHRGHIRPRRSPGSRASGARRAVSAISSTMSSCAAASPSSATSSPASSFSTSPTRTHPNCSPSCPSPRASTAPGPKGTTSTATRNSGAGSGASTWSTSPTPASRDWCIPSASGLRRRATFSVPHNPWVRDGLLYWAYYDAGLRVFDLTDPARPVEVAYHTYPGSGLERPAPRRRAGLRRRRHRGHPGLQAGPGGHRQPRRASVRYIGGRYPGGSPARGFQPRAEFPQPLQPVHLYPGRPGDRGPTWSCPFSTWRGKGSQPSPGGRTCRGPTPSPGTAATTSATSWPRGPTSTGLRADGRERTRKLVLLR